MIELTMDKGSSSIRMDGTDREIFAEATAIVNGLYMAEKIIRRWANFSKPVCVLIIAYGKAA